MKKSKYSRKYLIETGVGLQDVDHLSNSKYFKDVSNRYIKGEISLEEVEKLTSTYYKSRASHDVRTKEADQVSARIAKILSDDSFSFTVGYFLSIHRQLFKDLLKNAGELRGYNFSKKEWVLNGKTVTYGDYRELEATLNYDFNTEKNFDYSKLSQDEIIEHLALFISNLWQIHAFSEGNTRTISVFFIKYLRTLGFNVTNNTFSKNAWYFRNSLVRANYQNLSEGIYETREFLIKFLRNLLYKEHYVLSNRELSINFVSNVSANHITNLNSNHNKVLSLIRKNNKITTSQIAKEINKSVRTVKLYLDILQSNKLIRREGGKRFGYWKIKQ